VTQSEPGPGAPEPTPQPPSPVGQVPPATGQPSTDPQVEELRREAAKWRTELRAREQELEKLKAAGQTDAEKAVAEARKAGAAEYEVKWRKVLLDNAALTVLADKRVLATELALRGLDLSNVDVDTATGEVDRAALEAKVTELIQRYPMLSTEAAPLPGIGNVSGAQQHQVQRSQLARPGESEADAINRLARYALGND
jgi:acyl-CoA reductase-like NAD-dependent aldehyde dehydrogenase